MCKWSELKQKACAFFVTHKKASYSALGVFLVLVLSLGFYFFKDTLSSFFHKNFAVFEVNGGNFDLGIKKIPYNVKSIDIAFSKELDETSVMKSVFKMAPEVPGVLKLKNENTISYELSEPLKIGQDYTLSLSKTIKSFAGESLENDVVYIVSSVPAPKVQKVLPETVLENLSKNMVVFFSLPMVSFGDLDSRDGLPCPVEISPKVEADCKWTTTSVVEIIPKKTFEGATKYDYTIASKPGMNYDLEKTYTGSFSTPELTATSSETFIPRNAITLNLSSPVDKKELEKRLILKTPDNNTPVTGVWAERKIKVESLKDSQTSFIIELASGTFTYDTAYELTVLAGLNPKYGNIPTQKDQIFALRSTGLVSNLESYKNIYSTTGALIDTRYNSYEYLPNKDMFFKLSFFEDMPLKKDFFSFKNKKTGANVDFSLSYVKKEIIENNETKTVDDFQTVKLELKSPLENNSEYALTILKSANPSLVSDIVYDYKTSSDIKISSFKFIDYSRSCLYVNNTLDKLTDETLSSWEPGYYAGGEKFVSLSNSGVLKSFTLGQYIEDWQFEQSVRELSFEEKNKKLLSAGYCPEAATGEILYALETRLSPNSEFTLKVSGLQDVYGNTLKTDFTQKLKTGNLKSTDKFVYLSYANDTNVYPKSVPVVLNIQTVNTPKVLVEVCEMNDEDYKNYLSSPYRTFTCNKKISKELDTKLVYWKVVNNKFDVEKDILGRPSESNYFGIDVYADTSKSSATAKTLIQRTNMSVLVEKAQNKSLLYATDLVNHTEVADLELQFFDFNYNKTTIKYTFDKNKKVYVIDDSLGAVSYIIAKNAKMYAMVSENDQFSNYDFKYISGQDSSTKDFAYVYSDRPIYRPGDEVQIKGLLREFNFDGYKKSKITSGTLKLIGDDWSVYRTLEVKVDKNANFTGSFVIPKDSTLGNFRFQFAYIPAGLSYENDVYTNGGMSIEAYRKPTFKVNLETDKNDLTLGETTAIKVSPKYYFGGKMVNTDGTYSILSQNYFFDAKKYSDYQFGEGNDYFDCIYWGYCNYSDHLGNTLENFKIYENGEFILTHSFGKDPETAEKIYSFNFDVTDPDTLKTVSNSVSKVLHKTDGYVGLRANYYNSKEKGVYMQVATLDWEAHELPYKTVKVEVIKKDYKQVKKLGVDGIFYNEYNVEDKLESTFDLVTDAKALAKYNAKTKDTGEYQIKVSYTGANGQTFSSSQIVYVAGNDYISWGNDNNTITDLEADKITYKLGEKASFTLKSPVNNGKALIVVEKDDGILDYFVHDIKSYGDKIELKLTDKHYPNVYLKAYLIGSQKDNPLPVFKRALSVVKVVTDYKKLNVSIVTDKKNYKPADTMKVTIEVTDANGKLVPNANGSLSVVDESVLALKGNPKKNPYSFFYDMKRYLGVVSYTNLKYLIEKLEVKDVSGGEKGGAGDGVKGGETKKPRGNFKDTAYWLSDFTTDKNGKAVITIPVMPDNLTSWVLEALVTTPEDNKVGVNYETVMTALPVMIEDNLPRFVATDDSIVLSPVVYNRTGKDGEFKVSLKATGGKIDSIDKTVTIKNGESQTVTFKFDVKTAKDYNINDLAEVRITALSKTDATLSDAVVKKLPIVLGTMAENTSTVGKTADVSFDEKISLGNISKDQATLTLGYAGTLFSYLLDGVDYLANYPYGCAEQRTSAIMPNIYIKKLYDASGKEFDLKKKMVKRYIDNEVGYKEVSVDESIKDYLTEIKKFQNTDGGFVYWYDSEYKFSDIHLTSYILSSLSEIKSLGYEVDKNMTANAAKYLKSEFTKNKTCGENIFGKCISKELKVEILFALNTFDTKDYEVYNMYKTLDVSKMPRLYKADLASTLSQITTLSKTQKDTLQKEGIKIVNNALGEELVYNPKGAFLSASENSRVYNTTKLLEIMSELGLQNFKDSDSIIDNMIRFIASSKMNGSFGSTFDNSYVIKALTAYLSQTKELKNTDLTARFNLNGTQIEIANIHASNIFENYKKEMPVANLESNNIFNVEKEGTGNIYYDLNLKYYVPTINLKSRDEGMYVEKEYFSFNEYKKVEALKSEEYAKYLSGEIIYDNLKYPREVVEYLTPISSGKVGDLVLVYNKVVTNETRDQVALESYIPAGAEIVNTALATENKQVTDIATDMPLDRKEFRDDMYFGWVRELPAGIYNYSYTMRLTHAGTFQVKPSKASEFYTPEVFGRSSGGVFSVE